MKILSRIVTIGRDRGRTGFDFSKSKYIPSILYVDGLDVGFDVRVYPTLDGAVIVPGVRSDVIVVPLRDDLSGSIFKRGVGFRLWEVGFFASGEIVSVAD